MIYFDSAATTLQKPQSVFAVVQHAMRTCSSVGRGGHPAAMAAADAVYSCRERAGQLFDADVEQVAFTLNATHALNIAIKSIVPPGGRVVTSGFEHNAVTRPLHAIGAQVVKATSPLFSQEKTLAAFERQLTPGTAAAVCTHVSNVFGYILPIEGIARLCKKRGIPLIIDASQSAGTLPVSLRESGAAFIAMPGHKGLYGPQGTGILLCANGGEPLLEGGTGSNSAFLEMPDFMPDRLEAGTHNVSGIAGLRAGIDYVLFRTPQRIFAHEQHLLQQARQVLSGYRNLQLYAGDSQSGVLSFRAQDMDCETLGQEFARFGIATRAGLHCAPQAHESAGTFESGTVRISFSAFNTANEVRQFAGVCRRVFRRQ
ncbi:MAG: aminotransferase class V-fold PLP-dependent enzyme [Oscillospiraceae bacterium]|jgi:cysteine desulfurase family protein|nr:aminotransferase class V-fold PLP-dependent enzyme [Oscillospiraceae bacterium]